MFSRRSFFDLTPNSLSRALAEAQSSVSTLIDLTQSNPTAADLPYECEAVRVATACASADGYTPMAFGLRSAREAVGRELAAQGPAVDPDRIVLTASTSEAYAFLFKLLCDPGDEVLVPCPSYPLFAHLAQLECVRAVPYRVAYDGAWHLDLASVQAARSSRTRAIMTVSPNNPTGSYLKKSELSALGDLGLPIVSDEVFAQYPLREDGSRAGSALECATAPLIFGLGGLSKLAALPQLKLAWIAVGGRDDRVAGALGRLEVIADAFLSVGGPVQHALPSLFGAGRVTADAIRVRTRENLVWLGRRVAGSAATLLDAEGGWYATLRLPSTRSEDDWVHALLVEDGVYVHPGHFFDFEREPYVIVSLLTRPDAFREGMRRVLARVSG
ncbi:MAG: pyridoxal phosphate-dependent aminotransferase [Polyangiaceae bacterium]|jgi:aspartate/methionine/tyrosine aminotransferase